MADYIAGVIGIVAISIATLLISFRTFKSAYAKRLYAMYDPLLDSARLKTEQAEYERDQARKNYKWMSTNFHNQSAELQRARLNSERATLQANDNLITIEKQKKAHIRTQHRLESLERRQLLLRSRVKALQRATAKKKTSRA